MGKPLRLVDLGAYRRKTTSVISVIVTNAGIAVVEQFDRGGPDATTQEIRYSVNYLHAT
jgi:hypothetical protein